MEFGSKIFGIGYPKTGGTTLSMVLQQLGYKTCMGPYGLVKDMMKGNFETGDLEDPEIFEKFEAIVNIIGVYYKDIDRMCPGSKFILTIRDEESWKKSASWHMGNPARGGGRRRSKPWAPNPRRTKEEAEFVRAILFDGANLYEEEKYINSYTNFNKAVLEYFDGRDDLLVYNIVAGDRWEKVCDFLGAPVPDVEFPHGNIGAYRDLERGGK